MRKLIGFAEHVLFALNTLTIFFLLFESRLVVPAWLQIIGRMHPLVLHFPIVILILAIVLYFYSVVNKETTLPDYFKGLLLVGSLMAAATVLMGLILSHESGYSGSVLQWHKWGGVSVSIFASALYFLVSKSFRSVLLPSTIASITLVALMVAGHFGAVLTHGEDFILAPVRSAKMIKLVKIEDAILYNDVIAPLLEAKCTQCHNTSKAKGNLILTSPDDFLRGGKGGNLLKPGESLFMKRILLPLEDKKHMPPLGKEQLTDDEVVLFSHWIKSGADFNVKILELPTFDTLRILAQHQLLPRLQDEDAYDFPEADADVIEKLRSAYRVIYPTAIGSSGLSVTLFNASQYNAKLLEELNPIANQIVSLNLNKMPVTDQELKIIGKFANLRKLFLNFTSIDGSGLSELKSLKHLKSLSVSGTPVTDKHLSPLQSVESLKELYAWNSKITDEEMKVLQSKLKNVKIDVGFKPDQKKILRLTSPKVVQEKKIFSEDIPLVITHPIPGVSIRYTTDGSDPDSINSALFQKSITLTAPFSTIKAKAYKDGWQSSDISTVSFYKTLYRPDTIILTSPADKKYVPQGAALLTDLDAGDTHYASMEGWLGFQKNDFDSKIEFENSVTLSSVTVSTRVSLDENILPPKRISVYGGTDNNTLQLLATLTPEQPTEKRHINSGGYQCKFPSQSIKYLKVVAEPMKMMPAWHHKKKERAWLFVDELLFN